MAWTIFGLVVASLLVIVLGFVGLAALTNYVSQHTRWTWRTLHTPEDIHATLKEAFEAYTYASNTKLVDVKPEKYNEIATYMTGWMETFHINLVVTPAMVAAAHGESMAQSSSLSGILNRMMTGGGKS